VARRKILIVADDNVAARQLEQHLNTLGYDPTIASSGEKAIGMAADLAPDLALIERSLRGYTNAAATADELQGNNRVPSIFILNENDGENPGSSRVPERSYLVKPFTERELRATIELALCKRDSAQAVYQLEDQFFTSSIDLLCFLNFSGYFKRLNPAWERTLGFTRQELMSKPFIEFVHPDDRERTLKQNAEVRSGGKALSFENRYLCKDGSYKWLRWNAAPGSAERVIYSVARDITDAKRAEEERERLVSELQAALAEVNALREILPICSYCRKIRDDENYWHTVEDYISEHTMTRFSHGICPSCMATQVESGQLKESQRE
jgi:PAS domain S-box-containing protein